MDTYATWKAKFLADETNLPYQAWLEQEVTRLLAIEARLHSWRDSLSLHGDVNDWLRERIAELLGEKPEWHVEAQLTAITSEGGTGG